MLLPLLLDTLSNIFWLVALACYNVLGNQKIMAGNLG